MVERFLLPLAVCGLTIIVDPALAKGGPLHLFPSQLPPASRAGVPTPNLPSPSDFLSGCVAGATAMSLREDAEVQPMSAIKS
jgi:hypothetical protein